MNIHTAETVYLCVQCEQINETPECPICCQEGKPMRQNTADEMLWSENIKRFGDWMRNRRFIPEVE